MSPEPRRGGAGLQGSMEKAAAAQGEGRNPATRTGGLSGAEGPWEEVKMEIQGHHSWSRLGAGAPDHSGF